MVIEQIMQAIRGDEVDGIVASVIDKLNPTRWNSKDGLGLWHAVAAVVRAVEPDSYLEIGVRRGHSLCIAVAASLKPIALYGFDIWTENYGWESNPGPDLILPELKKFPNVKSVELFSGDSLETVPEFFAKNPINLDVSVVDGNHTYDGAKLDLANVAPHSRVIVCDDLFDEGVVRAWREFVRDHKEFQCDVIVENLVGVAERI